MQLARNSRPAGAELRVTRGGGWRAWLADVVAMATTWALHLRAGAVDRWGGGIGGDEVVEGGCLEGSKGEGGGESSAVERALVIEAPIGA